MSDNNGEGNISEQAKSATTQSFITSLVTNLVIAGVELILFLALRRLIRGVYEPRTYIPPRKEQSPPIGKNLLAPFWKIYKADPKDILRKNGVDPYVFVRFLWMLTKIMIPIWGVSWLILFPADAAGATQGKTGLDMFTSGNILNLDRWWAHLWLAYLFNGWIMYNIWVEMKHWLQVRQDYLISSKHSRLAQASTVLVTGIPPHLMDEEKLEQLYSYLPGGVKRIWLNRNLKDMPKIYDRRVKACKVLESAQVKLIKSAQKRHNEAQGKVAKLEKKGKPIPGKVHRAATMYADESEEGIRIGEMLVPREQRPKHRLKPKWAPFGLGFLGIGQKVDAIDWARQEIVQTTQQLTYERERLAQDIDSPGTSADETYPPLSSAFIHFNQQIAAHMAQQCLASSKPYTMNRRFIEQSPKNVIWSNMSLSDYEVNVRTLISYAITIGLLIAYAPMTVFIGSLSSVATLQEKFKWMSWIGGNDFGKKLLQGVICGILPPVLLAVLLMLVPIILRQLAKHQGMVSKTEVELSLMTRFFLFLVINKFIILTLSSGLVASIQDIANNPASIATTLSKQLPMASTLFITILLTQFTGTLGTLLMPVSVALYYVRVILGGGTPRSVFNSRYKLPSMQWGTSFPNITVYGVIMFSYMMISPVINGFGAAFFALSFFIYKYLLLYVDDQSTAEDTGGLFFPKAITHLFVGLYIQEVCLAALMFLARGPPPARKAAALPQGAMMVVLVAITVACNYVLNVAYDPLKTSLPLSLAHRSYGMSSSKEGDNESVDTDDDDPRLSTSKRPLNPVPPGLSSPEKSLVDYPTRPSRNGSTTTFSSGADKSDVFVDASSFNDDVKYNPYDHDWEAGKQSSLEVPRPAFSHGGSRAPSRASSKASLPLETVPIPLKENGDGDVELGDMGSKKGDFYDPSQHGEEEEEKEDPYFAQPGGPGVLRGLRDDGQDPAAFFHPASKDPQPIIWLPKDTLGLTAVELEENHAMGIRSTSKNAKMTEEAKIQVYGPQPDDHEDDKVLWDMAVAV